MDVLCATRLTPTPTFAGAQAMCLSDAAPLEAMLSAAPRCVLHLALAEPHEYGLGSLRELGSNGSQEDACIAYSLSLQARPPVFALWERGDVSGVQD